MKFLLVSVVLISFVTLFVAADDDHGENAVSFTQETFDSSVEKGKLFVMFFAPWCGHCKRLAPIWDELAKEVNVDGSKVTVGQVDCTKETALCSSQGVRGYPTVKFFNLESDGEKYPGARSIEALRSFVEEQLAKGEEKKEEPTGDEEVVDDKPEVTDGLYVLTDSTFTSHIAKGHHFIKFYAPWCGHCKRLAPIWEELAKEHTDGNVKIAKVDCTQHSSVCSEYGVRGYPTLKWFTDGDHKEDYREARTAEAFNNFITRLTGASDEAKKSEDGKVPDVKEEKEEPLPEATNGLYELTSANFDAHVASGSHFIKFYAPWCGHCKRLAPTWDELAQEFADSTNVKIAKIDCTQHREPCTKFEVRGYPTLLFIADGEKKPYGGARALEDLKKFVLNEVGADEAKSENLVELTDSDEFDEVVSEEHTIVLFIDGGAESVAMAPELKKIADEAAQKSESVLFATVNCKTNAKICESQKAEGPYPQAYFFRDGALVSKLTDKNSIADLKTFISDSLKKAALHDEL